MDMGSHQTVVDKIKGVFYLEFGEFLEITEVVIVTIKNELTVITAVHDMEVIIGWQKSRLTKHTPILTDIASFTSYRQKRI